MLYPLKFKPILEERIWGGHQLGEKMGKNCLQESSSVRAGRFHLFLATFQ